MKSSHKGWRLSRCIQLSSLWKTHHKATERHLPYEITECFVSPDTSEHTPRNLSHAGWYSIYPRGMEGWVDLGVGYIPRWFTCPQTVTHPSSNHLIATRPGLKLTTFWSWVQQHNLCTTRSSKLQRNVQEHAELLDKHEQLRLKMLPVLNLAYLGLILIKLAKTVILEVHV